MELRETNEGGIIQVARCGEGCGDAHKAVLLVGVLGESSKCGPD